ncbi:hypothetical protein ACFL0K_00625 [Patescibacteria group bacterium]
MENTKLMYVAIIAIIIIGAIVYSVNNDKVDNTGIISDTEEQVVDEPAEAVQDTSRTQTTSQTSSPKVPTRALVTQDGIYMVYYDNDGFYPSRMNIKVGTTVRFVNESDKPMRIFSDNQSSIYSALNQSKSLEKGAKYDFTFVHIGLWEYYNVNYISDRASITVY